MTSQSVALDPAAPPAGLAPEAPGADVRYPASLPADPLRKAIKLGLGGAMSALRPARRKRLMGGEFEWPLSFFDRSTLAFQGWWAERHGRIDALAKVHDRFWSGQGGMSVLATADWRYREMFLQHHEVIVPEIRRAVERLGCRTFVELGCGRGDVLDHVGRELPHLTRFVGVDLSEPMMRLCRSRYANPAYLFTSGDAADWVRGQGEPGTCFMSYGGVLEFLSQGRLQQMFGHIAAGLAPCVYALVEPLAEDFDLESETGSRPYGLERSLSHNYPRLLREAGFTTAWQTEMRLGPQRWLLIVAERTMPG